MLASGEQLAHRVERAPAGFQDYDLAAVAGELQRNDDRSRPSTDYAEVGVYCLGQARW